MRACVWLKKKTSLTLLRLSLNITHLLERHLAELRPTSVYIYNYIYIYILTLPIKATSASTAHSPQPTALSPKPDLPFSASKSSIFDPNHYLMCTFDQILTWVGLFFTHFSKIAQILTLLAHFLSKRLHYAHFWSNPYLTRPFSHRILENCPNPYLTRTCWRNFYLMLAFLAQILTLRAHVDEILTLRGFYCPVTPTNAGI